jgi:hypothetical protein
MNYKHQLSLEWSINVYHIYTLELKTASSQMRDWPLAFPSSFHAAHRQLYLIHGHECRAVCSFSRLSSRTQSRRFYAESRAKLSACAPRVNFSHIIVLSTNQLRRARSQIIRRAHQETETKRREFFREKNPIIIKCARVISTREFCARTANAERYSLLIFARRAFYSALFFSLSHYKAHGIFIVRGCFVSASRSRANIFICISDEILSLAGAPAS